MSRPSSQGGGSAHRRGGRLGPIAVLAAFGLAGTACAETPEPPAAPAGGDDGLFQPAAWPVGRGQLTPQLGLAAGHNSNLRMQAVGAQASPFTAWFPSLTWVLGQGDERQQIAWRSEITRFADSPLDNTINTELGADGLSLLDSQSALAWRLAWQDWHDSVGQASPDLPADAPDHFHAVAAGAVWRMDRGATAEHRLEWEPTLSSRRYLNHRDLTRRADVDTWGLVGRYLLQWDPAQRVGAELRWLRSHYAASDEAQSHADWRALMVWQGEPVREVHGTLKLGVEHRRFDSQRPVYGRASWEADLHWQARPATRFDLSATRAATDTPGEGADEAIGRRDALSWTQAWTPAWHSTLTAAVARNSYVNAQLPRDDRLRSLDLALRWDLGRRWQAGLNLGGLWRRSSVPDFSFGRRLSSISLTAAL